MMKILKLFMISLVLFTSSSSCKKDDIKEDLNNTLKITVFSGGSIQNAINEASFGDTINVQAGTYNEAIVLKNGVDLNLQSGVIIDWNGTTNEPTITDGGVAVTCAIYGDGTIKSSVQNSSSAFAFDITNASSDIKLYYHKIQTTNYSSAVHVNNGKLYLKGGLITTENGYACVEITTNGGNVTWEGDSIYSNGSAYGVLNSSKFVGNGTILTNTNSPIAPSGNINAYTEFSGYAKSLKSFGVECQGGTTYIHDATIESNGSDVYTGDAIVNGGGDVLKLKNCILKCATTDAYSIYRNGNYSNEVHVYGPVYVNRVVEPCVNIVEGSQYIIFGDPPVALTLQQRIDSKNTGDTVLIQPGTYTESINLKDGVDLVFIDGSILQYDGSGTDYKSTISDGGIAVHCTISGEGVFKRTANDHPFASVFYTSNENSDITFYYKKIESTSFSGPAVRINKGKLYLEGDVINSKYDAIYNAGDVTWKGGIIYSYGGRGLQNSYSGVFHGQGDITTDTPPNLTCFTPGISISGNYYCYVEFTGNITSKGDYALNMNGGSAKFYNSKLESWQTNSVTGSAISKTGGQELYLDNVMLRTSSTTAYSITSQGGSSGGPIYITVKSYADRPVQTNLMINGINLLYSLPVTNLTGTLTWGKSKYVTLTWSVEEGDSFEIWKDGSLLTTTSNTTYIDYVNGSFKQATYIVRNVVPTLQKSEMSVTVTK